MIGWFRICLRHVSHDQNNHSGWFIQLCDSEKSTGNPLPKNENPHMVTNEALQDQRVKLLSFLQGVISKRGQWLRSRAPIRERSHFERI